MVDETFEARAYSHLGTLIANVFASSTLAAQLAIEERLGGRECYCISIRGEYTSDGHKWSNHGGRLISTWTQGIGWRTF